MMLVNADCHGDALILAIPSEIINIHRRRLKRMARTNLEHQSVKKLTIVLIIYHY